VDPRFARLCGGNRRPETLHYGGPKYVLKHIPITKEETVQKSL